MHIALDQYLLFVSIVTLIVVTPGPNLFLLLGMAGNGRGTGLLVTLGFCAAVLSHVALALVGVGAVIATSALLFTAIKTLGAAYLMWMGVKSLLSLRGKGAALVPVRQVAPMSAPRAFATGYLTNILNPKPAIFYVAAFPQFLSAGEPGFYATGIVLGLTHAAIALLFYGSAALLMSRLARVLLRPMVGRAVKAVSGVALILLGGRLLLARAPS
ncbi:LysE family translocator [Rhodovarius crocodyli]|uniref:LysE family translocator n=2 Tax=Rhodovarius crocodyli TaxID=1979269 RepID=A0A437MFK8_9PROT|nr:LysE family translocator [Rhodovarius crocodyli]